MKKPLIPAGIEPATFRFVAQHLNHCATAVPHLWWYRYTLPDTHTQNTIPLRTHNLCTRTRACCLSASRLTIFTLQLPLKLASAVSVFIRLWCSEVTISWLGGWASHWRPPYRLFIAMISLNVTLTFTKVNKDGDYDRSCIIPLQVIISWLGGWASQWLPPYIHCHDYPKCDTDSYKS